MMQLVFLQTMMIRAADAFAMGAEATCTMMVLAAGSIILGRLMYLFLSR